MIRLIVLRESFWYKMIAGTVPALQTISKVRRKMPEFVHSPPESVCSSNEKTKPTVLLGGIVGLLLLIGPIQGLLGTVIGMLGAFTELEKTGTADPEDLASHISVALLTTLWGWLFSLVGMGIVLTYHFKGLIRKPWFYRANIAISAATLIIFPFGTISGGVVLWFFCRNRSVYFDQHAVRG